MWRTYAAQSGVAAGVLTMKVREGGYVIDAVVLVATGGKTAESSEDVLDQKSDAASSVTWSDLERSGAMLATSPEPNSLCYQNPRWGRREDHPRATPADRTERRDVVPE